MPTIFEDCRKGADHLCEETIFEDEHKLSGEVAGSLLRLLEGSCCPDMFAPSASAKD